MAFLCQTSGKIDPHDYLRISVALISILPLVENWLTQEKVLNRLKPLLFVLSIIQENYKNYKANNRKLSNLTGLRKKKNLMPGNTLMPSERAILSVFTVEFLSAYPSH